MIDEIIEILEKSIEKNGSVVLETRHLSNILKLAHRRIEEQENCDLSYWGLDWW